MVDFDVKIMFEILRFTGLTRPTPWQVIPLYCITDRLIHKSTSYPNFLANVLDAKAAPMPKPKTSRYLKVDHNGGILRDFNKVAIVSIFFWEYGVYREAPKNSPMKPKSRMTTDLVWLKLVNVYFPRKKYK